MLVTLPFIGNYKMHILSVLVYLYQTVVKSEHFHLIAKWLWGFVEKGVENDDTFTETNGYTLLHSRLLLISFFL